MPGLMRLPPLKNWLIAGRSESQSDRVEGKVMWLPWPLLSAGVCLLGMEWGCLWIGPGKVRQPVELEPTLDHAFIPLASSICTGTILFLLNLACTGTMSHLRSKVTLVTQKSLVQFQRLAHVEEPSSSWTCIFSGRMLPFLNAAWLVWHQCVNVKFKVQ